MARVTHVNQARQDQGTCSKCGDSRRWEDLVEVLEGGE